MFFQLIWYCFILYGASSDTIRTLREKYSIHSSPVVKRHHLKWISDQTVFPFSFQLPHYDEELADYDWYKYDRDTYVTQLENYRPNYFVSKQPYKTKLSLFKYDFKTNEQVKESINYLQIFKICF